MDSPDRNHANLNRILRKYRKVVRILRILPFAYLCVFAAVCLASPFMADGFAGILDCALFISPAVSVGTFLLSGALGMCGWHKLASILPYSSRLVSFADTNIITFTQNELVAINCAIGIAVASFIALAFRHFFLRDARLQTRT